MNITQANNKFDKLEVKINEILSIIPVNLIKEASELSESLREGMEEQIERLENKSKLNEDQESTLDRFQSTIEAVTNIDSILSSLTNAVEEFESLKRNIEDAKETI
ncbi:hypothetical protein [Paenibacillus sp. Mc5Re-14]|uniref:hypothetical protein n=1 Tax=Paenibacillus sp. Mc5Re-14 TaxID=1030529 RepID=UPI000B09823F|nr:hypothetical protein [Paenibacillus sp. Mc5Re-14]